MKRGVFLGGLVAALCVIGFLRHRPKRVTFGWRCERCNRPGGSLDDFGEPGHVSTTRRMFSRDAAGGHSETTREEQAS